MPPERRGIGYLSQEGNLFPHLTVAGNIGFGLARAERRDRARTAELLELVGLPLALADRRPEQLSGGQQQRVALARALARRPELVLLDEPFGSLDAGLRSSTRRAVADALSAAGATVLLVTHDQDEALSFADQVAIMRDGPVRAGRGAQGGLLDARSTAPRRASWVSWCCCPGTVTGHHVVTTLGSLPVAGAGVSGPVDVAVPARAGAWSAASTRRSVSGRGRRRRLLRPRRAGPHRLPAGSAGPGYVVFSRVLGDDAPTPGQLVGVTVRGPVLAFTPPAGDAS